jgi:hypothetical protein
MNSQSDKDFTEPEKIIYLTTVNMEKPYLTKLTAPLGEILINLTERLHDATS